MTLTQIVDSFIVYVSYGRTMMPSLEYYSINQLRILWSLHHLFSGETKTSEIAQFYRFYY